MVQQFAAQSDMCSVSRFWEDAQKVFETARCSLEAGHEISETTILVSPEGGISLIVDSDWPLNSLQAHRGAVVAYRVSQQRGKLRLEGRAGSQTCLFEAAKPNGVARSLLAESPTARLLTSTRLLPQGS